MSNKNIAILYHGGCPDGFGGAYAAWKKFGDTAEYIPLKHGRPIPENLDGKELYLIDFCYPQAEMDQLAKVAKSITVLDHHEGVRSVATQFPGVFDSSHSGATIAWSYFHRDTPVPALLTYVEAGDLYRFDIPDAREILAYVYTLTDSFASFETKNTEKWDEFVAQMETHEGRAEAIAIGKLFVQHHTHLVTRAIHHAELVQFEGYECYLTGASSEFKSDVGNRLAVLKPPIGIVVSADAYGLRVSLRSDRNNTNINVAELAQKYGGNGHPSSAGFEIPYGTPVPWTVIEKPKSNEDFSH